MKQTFLLLIALCISVLAIHGCKKAKDPEPDNPWGLPNATQEGANTFACRINGENWVSQKGIRNMGGGITDSTLGVHGTLTLNNYSLEKYKIYLFDTLIKTGSFRLNDSTKSRSVYSGIKVGCFVPKGGYETVDAYGYNGELLLTKVDTINKILSGTFWFNILTDHCDTMKVTEGRFDINYY